MPARTFRCIVVIAMALLLESPATPFGQTLQSTPPPAVTAENETWFLAGEPLSLSGSLYYPGGTQVFFNRYEMVRSGFYRGIPIYIKSTQEPFSIVFVPIAGGLMQPYERRRSGDLAGTVGATMPSFPGVVPTEQQAVASGVTEGVAQAAGPPTGGGMVGSTYPGTASTMGVSPAPSSTVAGTSGSVPASKVGPFRSAQKPVGLNGVFVQYGGRRWFSSGPAVPLNADRMKRIGEHQGFAVYSNRAKPGATIYVAVAKADDAMVAPYTRRR
jgi:hypothetical protein